MSAADAKPRRGRPPMPEGERKRSTFSVRLTAEERAEVEAAATGAALGASEWARGVLLTAARARP